MACCCDQRPAISLDRLRQLTVENVRLRGCVFTTYVHPLGVRKSSITNVSVIDNVGANEFQYLLRTASFDEVRVSNFSASGSFYGAILFDGGSPSAIMSLRDLRIANATMLFVAVSRQAPGAVAQSYEITDMLVQDSTAERNLIVTNASTSLTGFTMLNVTMSSPELFGDFPVISGVTVRRSLFNGAAGLLESRMAVPRSVVWAGFDVQASLFRSYFAILRCPPSVRINVTL